MNNPIHNKKIYTAGIHHFVTVGTGSTSVAIQDMVLQPDVNVMTIHNGNVGVGTIEPRSALHVVGNVLATGTVTASNISVIGDFVTLNTITSNTEQMVITNAGTGPALKVTQTGVNSIAEFYDNESGIALFVGNNGNVGVGTTDPQATFNIRANTSSTGVIIDQVGTGSILDIKDGGISKVIVDTNGNVGIGTTNPQASLHVNGFVRFKVPYYYARQYNFNTGARVGRLSYNHSVYSNVSSWYYFNSGNSYFKPEIAGVYYVSMTAIAAGAGNLHIKVRNASTGTEIFSHDDVHWNINNYGVWESIAASSLVTVNGIDQIITVEASGSGVWSSGNYHGSISIYYVSDI